MFRFENKPSSRIMLEKNPIVVCQEKNFYHQRFGKKILPKQNHPYPSSKVKWSVPNFYHVRYRLSL